MLPQQSYSHIVNTCDVPTPELDGGKEGVDPEKNITIIRKIIDDDDNYVIAYIYIRSSPVLQALTQSLQQFNEKDYIISILQVKKLFSFQEAKIRVACLRSTRRHPSS